MIVSNIENRRAQLTIILALLLLVRGRFLVISVLSFILLIILFVVLFWGRWRRSTSSPSVSSNTSQELAQETNTIFCSNKKKKYLWLPVLFCGLKNSSNPLGTLALSIPKSSETDPSKSEDDDDTNADFVTLEEGSKSDAAFIPEPATAVVAIVGSFPAAVKDLFVAVKVEVKFLFELIIFLIINSGFRHCRERQWRRIEIISLSWAKSIRMVQMIETRLHSI